MGISSPCQNRTRFSQRRARWATAVGILVLTALVVPAYGQDAGDADMDGDVDLDDFVILKSNFGMTVGATRAMGDFDGDGGVSLDDFVILKNHFGVTYTYDLALDCGGGVMLHLVRIAACTFMMGSPETEPDRQSDEGPAHQVTISQPFYMGTREVTIDQYLAYLNAGGDPSGVNVADGDCPIEAYGDGYRMKTTPGSYWGDLDQPMVEVDWYGARSFCQWLSPPTGWAAMLPTEAQWEYACRAGSTTRFHYGDDPTYALLSNYAWCWDGTTGAHPVGRKTPNAWGLYDMHGNVWEWCADWYGSYASANVVDPQGPASGSDRVARGGGWSSGGRACRAASRHGYNPDGAIGFLGFRVVVAPGDLD